MDSGLFRNDELKVQQPVQITIPKFSLRVELLGQLQKIAKPFIRAADDRRPDREQFSPMRPCVERREFPLKQRQNIRNDGSVLFPGEMKRNRITFVMRAQPKVVRGDGPDLRHKQVTPYLIAEAGY